MSGCLIPVYNADLQKSLPGQDDIKPTAILKLRDGRTVSPSPLNRDASKNQDLRADFQMSPSTTLDSCPISCRTCSRR